MNVGQMTLDELQTLIDQAVKRQLAEKLEQLQHQQINVSQADGRSLQEVYDSIDQHLWTPPLGAKSSLQLLREDRDR